MLFALGDSSVFSSLNINRRREKREDVNERCKSVEEGKSL